MDQDNEKARLLQLFVEISIIQQLAENKFNRLMPDGLHVSHFSVINHLVRMGDGRTPIQIANSFQIARSTMTNTLMVLEKRGLIKVIPNPEDGRSKQVFLTKEARDFLERAEEVLAPELQRMSSELDLKEIFKIIPALEDMRKYLDNNRG